MKRYLSLFGGGSFIGDTAITFLTSLAARLITLASMAVITRLYDPAAYGAWVLLLAFANFFLAFTNLRYDIALVLAPTQRMAQGILLGILGITAATVCIVFAISLLAPPQMLSWMTGLPQSDHNMIFVVPVILAVVAIQFLLQTWATRQRAFKTISISITAQAIVTAIVTIALPFAIGATAAAAGVGAIIGNLLTIAILGWHARNDLRAAFSSHLPWPVIRKSLHIYRVYPLFTLPFSLSVILTERIIQVTLAGAFSVSLLGTYFVARQLMQAPVSILASSIRNVLVAHGAREQTMDRTRFRVEGLLTSLILVVAPGLAYGVIWLEPTVAFVLGSEWPMLPQIAWWCMFPACALLFSGPLDRMPDMVGRQKLSVAMQLASDIVMLSVMFLCISQGFSALHTIASISTSLTLYNVIWLVVILHLIGVEMKNISYLFLKFFLLFALSFLAQYGLYFLNIGNIALLAGGIVMVVSCGIGIFWLARSIVSGKQSDVAVVPVEPFDASLNSLGGPL